MQYLIQCAMEALFKGVIIIKNPPKELFVIEYKNPVYSLLKFGVF